MKNIALEALALDWNNKFWGSVQRGGQRKIEEELTRGHGSFTVAVLRNNLREALINASPNNRRRIIDHIAWRTQPEVGHITDSMVFEACEAGWDAKNNKKFSGTDNEVTFLGVVEAISKWWK